MFALIDLPRFRARLHIAPLVTAALLLSSAEARAANHVHSHGTWFGYESGDRDQPPPFAYAKVDPTNDSFLGGGDSDRWGTIGRVRQRERDAVLWFRIANRSYIVRDRVVLERADELLAPERSLEPEQGRLDSLETRLEDEQSELDARQQKLSPRQDQLHEEDARLAADAGHARDDNREAGARRRAAIQRELREIERQIGEIDQRQLALGQAQETLGRQQELLGREQEKLSHEATALMRRLVDDALSRHLAERIHE